MSYRNKIRINQVMLDTSELVPLYQKLKGLKQQAALANGTRFQELFKTKIRELRSDIKNNYGTSFFEVALSFGKKTSTQEFTQWPTAQDIKQAVDEMFKEVRSKRKLSKEVRYEHAEWYGTRYEKLGGVLTKAGSILDMQNKINHEQRLIKAKRPHPKIKDNYVGIELELIAQSVRDDIEEDMAKQKLGNYVYIKSDSSIRTDSRGGYTHEVTVMCKQQDVQHVMAKVIAVLNKHGAYVNNSCGMHVHIDMRNRDVDKSYARLFQTQALLVNLVGVERKTNTYCKMNTKTTFKEAVQHHDKYYTINPQTYNSYRTLEVRLHGGCVNLNKIVNWVKLLTYIVDTEGSLKVPVTTPYDFIAHYPNVNTKMSDYVAERYTDITTKSIITEQDHISFNNYEMVV
jgi:hypothetical protein